MQFFKVKKWLKEQQKPHQLTNQRFTVNSSSSSSPPEKGKSQLLLTSIRLQHDVHPCWSGVLWVFNIFYQLLPYYICCTQKLCGLACRLIKRASPLVSK